MRTIFLPVLLITFYLFLFCTSWGQTCDDWLKVPNQPSYVRIGDLDITGDKVTVEAVFNRTAPWNGVDLYQGDLVSKHEDPRDCNYLLRPSSAEITTNIGYFRTPAICPIELNKTYHAAMVYDGRTLKFYRNGFLMSQVAATGDLVTNEWQTQIGLYFGGVTHENFIGYINEVRIWNIARTQDQIKGFMDRSLPNPQGTPGLLAYYTFNNLLNKQGNNTWNGKLGGSAAINQTNPKCSFVADSCGKIPCEDAKKPDFQYERDVCSPKMIRFTTRLDNIKTYQWDFGDGQKVTGQVNPTVTYSGSNSYKVKLKVEADNGCLDSTEKTIPVQVLDADIIKIQDATICSGDGIMLETNTNYLDYCWQTSNNQTVPAQLNPIVSPSGAAVYSITARKTGINLVKNADFSAGNTLFNSGYIFSNSGVSPGVFSVSSQPEDWSTGMTACRDHTTGNGNMMMVNGSTQVNQVVWGQAVSVRPNTEYAFITWIQSLTAINPSRLQVLINGKPVGNNIIANSQGCAWHQYYTMWNSGTSTTATIALVNVSQDGTGNDFALDDLFFGELLWETDQVEINVRQKSSFSIQPLTAAVCKGDSVRLTASGGDLYEWKSNVLSPHSASTFVIPDTTAYYQVNIKDNICHSEDSLVTLINVIPKPLLSVEKSNDIDCFTADARLNVTGAIRYVWNAASSLSNRNISDPIATPHQTTTYFVKGFSAEGCTSLDSIEVKVLTTERSSFLLPSAFTPNYDGINNCFGIKYWGPITEFSMKIFDRWGKLVFETIDPKVCWNGRYKSIDQPVGLYVYMISAQTLCGNVLKRGTISLLR